MCPGICIAGLLLVFEHNQACCRSLTHPTLSEVYTYCPLLVLPLLKHLDHSITLQCTRLVAVDLETAADDGTPCADVSFARDQSLRCTLYASAYRRDGSQADSSGLHSYRLRLRLRLHPRTHGQPALYIRCTSTYRRDRRRTDSSGLHFIRRHRLCRWFWWLRLRSRGQHLWCTRCTSTYGRDGRWAGSRWYKWLQLWVWTETLPQGFCR